MKQFSLVNEFKLLPWAILPHYSEDGGNHCKLIYPHTEPVIKHITVYSYIKKLLKAHFLDLDNMRRQLAEEL